MRKEDLLPLPLPKLRQVTPELGKDEVEEILTRFEQVREENNERFRKAQFRMNLCAHLRGFIEGPFTTTSIQERLDNPEYHFKWCPHPEWWKHTSTSLF